MIFDTRQRPEPLSPTETPSPLHPRVHNADALRARYGSAVDHLASYLTPCDPLADALVAAMTDDTRGEVRRSFERALAHGLDHTPDASQEVRALMTQVEHVPPWVDPRRLNQGGRIFLRADFLSGLVLGAKSLVYGYCAPAGNKPLVFSGQLTHKAVRRLNETSRFVQAVVTPGGMDRFGDGFAITVRVRVMHAKVRALLRRSERWRADLWAEPINQHDMVATILLFSSVLLRGLRRLGFQPSIGEAEDYMHLWRYVGHLIGVAPELLPTTEAEARWLQDLILEMQGPPDEDSRALTRALLEAPLRAARTPRERRLAELRVNFSSGLCRAMLGDELADALELRDNRWRHVIDVINALVSRGERLGSWMPALQKHAIRRGERHWAHVITLAGGKDARFDPPERLLHTNP